MSSVAIFREGVHEHRARSLWYKGQTMTKMLFEYYRQGLQKLIAAIGDDHPHVPTLRILQQRLVENLITPPTTDLPATQRAIAHAEILDALNRLCLELTGKPFGAFCEVSEVTTTPLLGEKEPLLSFTEYMYWLDSLLTSNKIRQPEIQAAIQARTLAILEHSTPLEKGKLVQALYNAGLISTNTPLIRLSQANLKRVHLAEAELNGVNFANANMQGANLVGALLKRADLSQAILVGANLGWSVMEQSRLNNVELGGATLTGSDLRAADLRNAHLIMANFKWADLSQANLAGANLLRANLEEATLTAADLHSTILLWTNFTKARLDGVFLDKATYNQYTLWPEDFDPPAAGAIQIA